MMIPFRELDSVVLVRDIPAGGLRAGALGAIVMLYTPNDFEVEFATASGDAQAVIALNSRDVRPMKDTDLPKG